jgi:hypothetical protein
VPGMALERVLLARLAAGQAAIAPSASLPVQPEDLDGLTGRVLEPDRDLVPRVTAAIRRRRVGQQLLRLGEDRFVVQSSLLTMKAERAAADPKSHGVLIDVQFQILQRQAFASSVGDARFPQRLGQSSVVEGRLPASQLGIDQDKLMSAWSGIDAVPEVSPVVHPVGPHVLPKHLARSSPSQTGGSLVIGLGTLSQGSLTGNQQGPCHH